MNTYTWIIDSLDCIPSNNEQTNVVCNVHWRVNANNGQFTEVKNINGSVLNLYTYQATSYGVQSLTYTAGTPFTPFEQLTEETIIGWVQSALGAEQVTSIQANLDTQIDNLVNPPIVSPRLPWLLNA